LIFVISLLALIFVWLFTATTNFRDASATSVEAAKAKKPKKKTYKKGAQACEFNCSIVELVTLFSPFNPLMTTPQPP